MTDTANDTAGMRKLPIWGFVVLAVVYIAIIQGVGLVVAHWAEPDDGKLLTVKQLLVNLWIPLGIALAFVYGIIAILGWWRPVFHDHKPVQRWVRVVPIVFIVAIAVGINYPGLADKGLAFTVTLLIATQLVGWGEEGMFRGIGVTSFRMNGFTEGKVALWTSILFGAVHLSNAVGKGASAIPQAIVVSLAGYFFYLIRRVSHSNVMNSVLHGLFDFTLISGGAIKAKQELYPGALAPLALYFVLAIILFVRRHRIELTTAAPMAAS